MSLILSDCVYVGWILLSLMNIVSPQVTNGPKNTWALRGESVTFHCTITSHIQNWLEYFRVIGGTIASNTNVFPNYNNDFAILGSRLPYSLQLKQGWSDMSYGGKYACEDGFTNSRPNIAYAELIALESHPVFEHPSSDSATVIEGELVHLTCRINYRGRWPPVFIWMDEHNNTISSQLGPGARAGSVVESYIELNVSLSNHGLTYRCRCMFEDINSGPNPPTEDEDTTAIDYDKTLTSNQLIVHYPPRNTVIRSEYGDEITDGSELYYGQLLTCSSTSYPAVDQYEWTDVSNNNNIIGDTSDLRIIQLEWLDGFQLKCTVRNSIGENQDKIGEDSITVTTVKTNTPATAAPGTPCFPCPRVCAGPSSTPSPSSPTPTPTPTEDPITLQSGPEAQEQESSDCFPVWATVLINIGVSMVVIITFLVAKKIFSNRQDNTNVKVQETHDKEVSKVGDGNDTFAASIASSPNEANSIQTPNNSSITSDAGNSTISQ